MPSALECIGRFSADAKARGIGRDDFRVSRLELAKLVLERVVFSIRDFRRVLDVIPAPVVGDEVVKLPSSSVRPFPAGRHHVARPEPGGSALW